MIKKFITDGVTLEVGDFYGGGEDEVIQSMEDKGSTLQINTSHGFYDLSLKPGDYISDDSGSAKIVKSKYDKQDE